MRPRVSMQVPQQAAAPPWRTMLSEHAIEVVVAGRRLLTGGSAGHRVTQQNGAPLRALVVR